MASSISGKPEVRQDPIQLYYLGVRGHQVNP